jgi:AcrR family transcriptional regulator
MPNMPKRSQRRYRSAHREEQAEQTRRRIEDAAHRLFLRKGVDETTIGAIARTAGVAAPTVYAIFKSKRGIVERLVERAAFTPAYDALVREALGSHDPATRLRYAARICRGICDSLRGQAKLLRAASAIAPDLMRDKERMRFERQAGLIDLLARSKALRPGVTRFTARDILWTLTSPDIYRNLVVERRWGSQRYENWLGDTLVSALLKPRRVKSK